MQFVLTLLAQNWVGTLIGLIGVVLGVHFYRASRVGARLAYQAGGLRVIGGKEPELPTEVTVLFNNQAVSRVTKTVVVLWNCGTRTISGEDVVADDPLRITFEEEAEILKADVIDRTKDVNKFRVEKSTTLPHEAICWFDYLDAGDGVVMEVLHTSSERFPRIAGSVRGIPRGVADYGGLPIWRSRSRRTYLYSPRNPRQLVWAMLIYGLVCVVMGILALTDVLSTESPPSRGLELGVGFAGFVFVAFGLLLLWVTRRRFPRALSVDI